MFIDTTGTVIKAVMNIEHCSQNFKNYSKKWVCSHTSSSLGSWPWPDAARNKYFTHTSLCSSTFTLSLNICSLLRRCITHSVACEHKNPSLTARCLAMRWLPRHLLNACCIAVSRLHRHPLFTCCVSMRTLPMHLWTLVLYSIISFLDTSTLFHTMLSVSCSRKHEKDLVVSPCNSKALA